MFSSKKNWSWLHSASSTQQSVSHLVTDNNTIIIPSHKTFMKCQVRWMWQNEKGKHSVFRWVFHKYYFILNIVLIIQHPGCCTLITGTEKGHQKGCCAVCGEHVQPPLKSRCIQIHLILRKTSDTFGWLLESESEMAR